MYISGHNSAYLTNNILKLTLERKKIGFKNGIGIDSVIFFVIMTC